MSGIVPGFMLPSPVEVVQAFINDSQLILSHSGITMLETVIGLILGIIIGFVFAVLMDMFSWLRKMLYPLIVISQTIPTVAIAPLLVLWFGYEMTPKVILIVLVVFFPIAVSLLDGFESVDSDTVRLMRTMGAGRTQIFRYVKFPAALGQFFSSLKISVSYAVVSAVVSEWIGGVQGLGVYMTRVRKAYSYDKMFAVIFMISALSLALIWLVTILQKRAMPWEKVKKLKA
jgi:ABC-type nitrate/sulfonate/bicarbonate transport system permease component